MNFSTSLICCNLSNISSDIDKIFSESKEDNRFKWFHADFMDGHFVPRLGISPELIQYLRRQYGNDIIIDSHMMVDDPFAYADVICPYSDYYMFHVEAVNDPMRTIQKVRKNWPNVKVGLYFNLSTDIEDYKFILSEIDCIGLMGISPGVLGTSSYKSIVLNKLDEYKNIAYKRPAEIFIDGSVNFDTIPTYMNNGVTTVVCGTSSIMNKNPLSGKINISDNIKKIKSLC